MTNVDLHRAAHAAFNTEGAEATGAFFADKATYFDGARGINLTSKAELVSWLGEWKTAFSDATVAQPRYIDAGDWTICRFQGQGTNDGSLGGMPATGHKMDLPFCELTRWADGKVVEGGLYYDAMTMMVQLGHAQQPATAG